LFRKDALRLGSNIFETFGFAPRKISRWNNLFVFSTTDVFVPVSQLSTRDLFDFLENLKIKQDIFVLGFSRVVWSLKQRALWFFYSRLFFGIVFKRMLSLEYFYKVNCGFSWIFDTSLREGVFICWLVKKIITFESRETCRECLFVLKDFVTWLSLLFFLRFFLFISGEKRI